MNLRHAVTQAIGQWDLSVARGGGKKGGGPKDACANACRTVRGRQVDPDGCNNCLMRQVKGDVQFAPAKCATTCSPTSSGGCACYTSGGDVIKCSGCTQPRFSTAQVYSPYSASLYGCGVGQYLPGYSMDWSFGARATSHERLRKCANKCRMDKWGNLIDPVGCNECLVAQTSIAARNARLARPTLPQTYSNRVASLYGCK